MKPPVRQPFEGLTGGKARTVQVEQQRHSKLGSGAKPCGEVPACRDKNRQYHGGNKHDDKRIGAFSLEFAEHDPILLAPQAP